MATSNVTRILNLVVIGLFIILIKHLLTPLLNVVDSEPVTTTAAYQNNLQSPANIKSKPASGIQGAINAKVPWVQLRYGVCAKGTEPWDREWLKQQIPKFLKVYQNRPADDQKASPLLHHFAVWCTIQVLKPKTVIQSGIRRGLETWIVRQVAPEAQIILLDPAQQHPMVYIDNHTDTLYLTNEKFRDFGTIHTWKDISFDGENTLAFIGDHNSPFKRLPQARRVGIRHMIYEDNYWLGQNIDCFTLKHGCGCLLNEPECSLLKWREDNGKIVRNLTV